MNNPSSHSLAIIFLESDRIAFAPSPTWNRSGREACSAAMPFQGSVGPGRGWESPPHPCGILDRGKAAWGQGGLGVRAHRGGGGDVMFGLVGCHVR